MAGENRKRRGGFDLNTDFPRILTLLRKEKGYSQKKVAADLGVSQALLSHYEKGIRECGLDFVARVSDYYGVSCDYLLGRTPQRNGAVIDLKDTAADAGPAGKPGKKGKSTAADQLEYNRRILVNSVNIVFAILKKINSESLSAEVTLYLSAAVYKIFRVLYSSNPKNPQGIFSLDFPLFGATLQSCIAMSEAKSRYILSGEGIAGSAGVKKDAIPALTPESLLRDYPQYAPSLFDLIRRTENSAKAGPK